MDKAGVQVLKKVHVRGAEAGVVIEIISGGDGKGDLRQLHHSGLTHSHKQGGPRRRLGSQRETGGPRARLGVREGEASGPKTTAGGGLEEEHRASSGECQTSLDPPG